MALLENHKKLDTPPCFQSGDILLYYYFNLFSLEPEDFFKLNAKKLLPGSPFSKPRKYNIDINVMI